MSATDIGVMAPYRSQVQKLRLLLRERGLGEVRVGTVDDYQVRPTQGNPYDTHYGTPYGNPYGNPYGTPYGTPYGNPCGIVGVLIRSFRWGVGPRREGGVHFDGCDGAREGEEAAEVRFAHWAARERETLQRGHHAGEGEDADGGGGG